MEKDRKICVGMIAGAHGVRGLVRLRSFTEIPDQIGDYGKLTDEDGERVFDIALKSVVKNEFIASIKGLADKNGADALRGTKLYVPRAALPKTKKREYYEADLIGLAARGKDGKDFGKVLSVHDYGAGPFVEIGQGKKESFMLPFNTACVPEIDTKEGFLTVVPPEGWLEDVMPKPKGKKKAGGDDHE